MVNKNTISLNTMVKVPMIRMEVYSPHDKGNSNYHQQHRARKIDITVIDKNHNGQEIVNYINQLLSMIPELQPIYFIIKTLSYQFKLYDPKNGGIRSYGIFVMLALFLQHHMPDRSIAQRLLDFLYYFSYLY